MSSIAGVTALDHGLVLSDPRQLFNYHFCSGHLCEQAGGNQSARVQGHEVGATIVAIGPGCRPELAVGQRVAMRPLLCLRALLSVQPRAHHSRARTSS